MPTAQKDTKDIKRENFANVREALEGAGTTVLSHLGDSTDRAVRPTIEDVEKFLEENQPVVLGYGGPYTDPDDQRNAWTYEQTAEAPAGTSRTRKQLELGEKQARDFAEAEKQLREDRAGSGRPGDQERQR
jgi:hypothetical protein